VPQNIDERLKQSWIEAARWARAALKEIEYAFSGLGALVALPIAVQVGGAVALHEDPGWGLWFYVGWGDPASQVYSEIEQAVRKFRGALTWRIRPDLNDRGAMISALPEKQIQALFGGQSGVPVSLADMRHDVEQFCAFVRESLANPAAVPSGKQKPDATPFEDSVYTVYLVANPKAFGGSPTSPLDRELHYGITREELDSLSQQVDDFSDCLGPREAAFLSELVSRYEGTDVRPADVMILKNGLQRLETTVADTEQRKAVGKVLRILGEAANENLGIVFAPKD
jgi:hypothetical protein